MAVCVSVSLQCRSASHSPPRRVPGCSAPALVFQTARLGHCGHSLLPPPCKPPGAIAPAAYCNLAACVSRLPSSVRHRQHHRDISTLRPCISQRQLSCSDCTQRRRIDLTQRPHSSLHTSTTRVMHPGIVAPEMTRHTSPSCNDAPVPPTCSTHPQRLTHPTTADFIHST